MPIYSLTALQRFRSQEIRNVFYYQTTDVLSAAQGQEAADAVRAAYVNLDFGSRMVNDWEIYGIDLRRVDTADLPGTIFNFTSGPYVGTATAEPGVANQVCLLVSAAATTTKPRRARTYIGGVRNAEIGDNGFWSSNIIGNALTWRTAMDVITVTGDSLLRVAVQFSGSPPAVSASNRLTVYATKSNPAIQRRRRIGFGA